jgi:DmsE family decaheme c-type cytochrome
MLNTMKFCRFHAVIATLLVGLPLTVSAQSADEASPEFSRKGADTCIGCHEDEITLAIFKTRHGVPSDARSPFGAGQLQCEACHGPGGDHAGRVRRGEERPPVIRFGQDSEASGLAQNGMCLACHEANASFAWHGSGHDDNRVGCADCHEVHNAHDPVRVTASQPQVCFDCHQQQHSQSLKPYSHPFDEGKMDCSGCHDPHGPGTTNTLFVRQTINDTCFDCHAEKRGPYLWEHAPVAEDCASCHEPHGSNNPGMVSLRGPMLCQTCHSQAGHPSIANEPDGLAGSTPSEYLLLRNCLNCHTQVHGSNHPSGSKLMR